ncbi:MAG TPA: alpha/beta fold hydrolase [Burkholderiales bacterium]|nr:alpha/beta fold hydrolase [Burkholderiales bacterium]
MRTTRRQSLRYLAGFAAAGALAGCAAPRPSGRSSFVLVHGGWHGPWCWDRISPLLRDAGHRVSAVNLHGEGADHLPTEQTTLAHYVARIRRAIDAADAPVVLVAHSSGALSAQQAVEEQPERVRTIVFLSAFVARNGESGRMLQGKDPAQKVSPVLRVDFRPGSKIPYQTRIDMSSFEAVKLAFYNDCSDADARAAVAQLVPEPTAPAGQPLRLTPERFGRVDKVYIHCSQDNAISLGRQREFATQWPLRRTLTVESGHSPFLSMPARLASILGEIGV